MAACPVGAGAGWERAAERVPSGSLGERLLTPPGESADAFKRLRDGLALSAAQRAVLARRRAGSRLAFSGVDRGSVLAVLRSEHPFVARSEPFAPLRGRAVKRVLSEHAAVIEPGDEGRRSLVASSLPLADGGVPIDMHVREDAGGGFSVTRGVEPVAVAATAAGVSSIGAAADAVGVRAAGVASVAGQASEAGVLYASVARDTDFLVKPVPGGLETTHVLRSVQSPETHVLQFDVPAGARVEPFSRGQARVVRGDETLGVITAPVAWDADLQPVPVDVAWEGTTLRLQVAHRDRDVTYPLLVDPVIERSSHNGQYYPAGHTWHGWQSWYSSTTPDRWELAWKPWYQPDALSIMAYGGWHGHHAMAQWHYAAPGPTARMWHARFLSWGKWNPTEEARAGMWSAERGFWETNQWGDWQVFSTTGSFDGWNPRFCPLPAYRPAYGQPEPGCIDWGGTYGNAAVFSLLMLGDGHRAQNTHSWVRGIEVAIADWHAPTVSVTKPSAWTADGQVAITASDTGLGVRHVIVEAPNQPQWNGRMEHTYDCDGSTWRPCPRDPVLRPQIGNLPKGQNHTLLVYVTDAVGNVLAAPHDVIVGVAPAVADDSLMREDGQSHIWAFKNNRRHWVTSTDVAAAAGINLASVQVVSSGALASFQQGYDITAANATTWRFGGSNADIDTDGEGDAAISFLADPETRERRWDGLTDDDKTDLAAMDALERWGEAAPTDPSTDLGSYPGWDGEPYELDQWVPAQDQIEVYDVPPTASASGLAAGVAVVGVALTCLRWCDDAVRGVNAVRKLSNGKKVIRGKRPQPKSWKVQRPDADWVKQAGSKPSRALENAMDPIPGGLRSSWRPHHIIPAGGRAARTAQAIARQCGIHPNEKANGAWLPKDTNTRDTVLKTERVPHSVVHTRHYYQNVNRIIHQNYHDGPYTQSVKCARVRAALRTIQEALEDGSFAF